MAKKRKQYPSQARLRELFDYDAENGSLVRKDGSSESIVRLSPKHHSLHRRTWFNGYEYRTCELVWIFHKGDIPSGLYVSSLAGNYSSKIEDLVLADSMGVIARQGKRSGEGYVGVHQQSHKQKHGPVYICQFSYQRDYAYKGSFSTPEAAAACYDYWAKKIFGKHAILNGVVCDFEKYRLTLNTPPKTGWSRSGLRGVYANKSRWMARIKKKYLGTFDTKEQAARAYNKAAYEHYGDHAVLNDIPDPLGLAEPDEGDAF